MTTRELVFDDGRTKTYRVKDGDFVVGTDQEIIPTAEETNARTLQDRARSALATNNTYLAKPTTTNAEDKAQLKVLTQECSAVIRLLLNQTDTTEGT